MSGSKQFLNGVKKGSRDAFVIVFAFLFVALFIIGIIVFAEVLVAL